MRLSRCLLWGLGLVTTIFFGCADGDTSRKKTTPPTGGSGGTGGDGGAGGATLDSLGTTCSDTDSCESGFCVDGVCCDAICDSECFTCSGSNAGTCTPMDVDTDPDDECGLATCDGAGACLYAAHRWSASYGDFVDDMIRDVAVDSQGDVIVVGEFNGTIDFGGTLLTAAGDDDAFVVKLAGDGTVIWAQSFGETTGNSNQRARTVAIGDQDRIIFSGDYGAEIGFGGPVHSAVSVSDFYVAALNSDGSYAWSTSYGPVSAGLTTRLPIDIIVDGSNDVIVTGNFNGDIDFGANVVDDGSGTLRSTFVLKLDQDGSHLWSGAYGVGTGTDHGMALASAPNGDVFVCGFFKESIDFGTFMTSAGGEDIYVVRLDANGNELWSKRFGDGADQRCTSLSLDADGQLWFAGSFGGDVNFGGGDISAADIDPFVVQLDTDGTFLSAMTWQGIDDQEVSAIVHDSAGNLVLSGVMRGGIDFGGGLLTSASVEDTFLLKLDATATHLWSRRYGDLDAQVPFGLATFADGDIALGVQFNDAIDFGGGILVNEGARDVAITRIGP
jgi:hypothetical protein